MSLKRFTRLLLAGAIILGLSAITACSNTADEPTEPTQAETPPTTEQPAVEEPTAAEIPEFPGKTKDVKKLEIEDVTEGDGAEAVVGKSVTVNYTGWLTDGTMFDSSFKAGQPFTFALGSGMVIAGWEEGVAGMKVGGTRLLVIPPDKGYGEQGAGGVIPPNATLVFQVDLLGVE